MNPAILPGAFLLRLVFFTLCCCSSLLAKSQLHADFTQDVSSGCAPIVVQFHDVSTGNPTEWRWDLGNGTYSSQQHPSVSYFSPGQYSIKLVVKNGANSDSVSRTQLINVYASPIAKFSVNDSTGCSPVTFQFRDASGAVAAPISAWRWDFGDGNLSSAANPLHTYTTAGNFNVLLKVTDAHGCEGSVRKTALIKTHGVIANFSSQISDSCKPTTISFQNGSTSDEAYSIHWNFGDGTTSTQTNPIKTYAAAGTYSVLLTVQSLHGCVDTIRRSFTMSAPVNAQFTADRVVGCRAPMLVNFQSTSVPGSSYIWNFGDTIGYGANPTHRYADTGIYTVQLIVRASNGCTDTVTKSRYIQISKPFPKLLRLPDSACIGYTRSFAAQINSSDSIVAYQWNFGDGGTATGPNPAHTYNNPGYFNISLVVTTALGCRDTVKMNNAMRISTKPQAAFTASDFNTCAKTEIHFTNLSSSNATSWLWNLGGNATSTQQHPIQVYHDTGWMNVQLITYNGGCADTALANHYIYIKPAVAKFQFNMNCDTPLVRRFTDRSIGADSWRWDFGDGVWSTEQNPTHTYPGFGVYFVTLYVYNSVTGCDFSRTQRIRVMDVTPSVRVNNTRFCKNDTVRLECNLTNADIGRYIWNFGDGSTFSTGLNKVTHVYRRSGTFQIRLTTIDSIGCIDTLLVPVTIQVNAPNPRFSTVPVACANNTVVFNDQSTAPINPIVEWIWRYGDGNSDTLTSGPFEYSYVNSGLYPVQLKLKDTQGCTDSFRLPTPLRISKPNPRILLTDSVACVNLPVRMVCPYYTPGIRYEWDFGDGTTSNIQQPVHQYTQTGTYSIKLVIRETYGCSDSMYLPNAVRVVDTRAVFTISDSLQLCPPLLVQCSNQSVDANSYFWDFGDSTYSYLPNPSHYYTYPGNYTITLQAKGPGTCAKTMQRHVVVKGPTGTITYTPLQSCIAQPVNFVVSSNNAVSYIWDYNDGVTVTDSNTTSQHIYQDMGNYLPKIILVDDAGCRVPVKGRDTLRTYGVQARFSSSDTLVCGSGNVQFTNGSSGNDSIITYQWNFADGTQASSNNPVHVYQTPGLYYPQLIVTSSLGCKDTVASTIPIRVAIKPQVSIQGGNNGCVPLSATFHVQNNLSSLPIYQWKWDFGNGNSFIGDTPPVQLYAQAGQFNVNLLAMANNGCSSMVQKVVSAWAVPMLNIQFDTLVCRNSSSTLVATGANRYKWTPAATLSCDTCASTIARPLTDTRYFLTGTSTNGCVKRDSVLLKVKQPFSMTFGRPETLCIGQTKRLFASGADRYDWTPRVGLTNPSIATPEARPDTTTTYRVIGKDNQGCFADTGYIKLTVFPIPTVDAGIDQTISIGTSTDLVARFSPDVTELFWSPTGSVFRSTVDGISVKPARTTEYTVEAKNPGGCSAQDRVTVFVTCNGQNVFIPNLFSPNRDGVNDVFYPRGVGLLKIKSLKIYSRWGQEVFAKTSFNANDPASGWDGTLRGTPLNADVFVYKLELICDNNTVMAMNGNIALVR